ncbi:PAC2 family protein [Bifidobacterium tsurumiense]|nr:PAC2 family protein [Bifidobacterium tsurumiense]MDY4678795.1 PAC2 family protein [Bifidobacterium tsurumiense]MSS11968.1 PAC2 family protein [Bifidobacterium tsurumiense]
METAGNARRTFLIAAFEGWNDACQASTGVIRHLMSHYESREVRHIRCDGFYDYQSTRPMVCHVTGRRRILWPQTTFFAIDINPETRIYAQIAPEPNYRWIDYCRTSLRIAEEFEVTDIVTLGSMFAECPHTRPLPLDVSDSHKQCEMDREFDGPVGIPTVLDAIAQEENFSTASIWSSIPQYLGGDDCAQATLQMLDRLAFILGTELDKGNLPVKAAQWKHQAEDITDSSEDLGEYVRHLEHEYDLKAQAKAIAGEGAPRAEQLVKEAEEFLKDMGNCM